MTIYALRVEDNTQRMIYESLQNGEGRFGWSYVETADLHDLKNRLKQDGWDSLTVEEQDCYQNFLLEFQDGDYVVYINVPEWGKCTLAKVTGKYCWRFKDEDFNHRFPVSSNSVKSFDRNDASHVAPALSARLKLQGRWWTIYTEAEFNRLLGSLNDGIIPEPSTPETNLRYLSESLRPHLLNITGEIHHTHPNTDLEFLFMKVFEKVPGVKKVTRNGGPADHGADLLVDFEFDSIPGLVIQETLVVQVKSYEGEHGNPSAVDDIKRAFDEYKQASRGLIISTGTSPGENLRRELEKLQKDSEKPVSLLIGADVAAFFLKFGSDLLN